MKTEKQGDAFVRRQGSRVFKQLAGCGLDAGQVGDAIHERLTAMTADGRWGRRSWLRGVSLPNEEGFRIVDGLDGMKKLFSGLVAGNDPRRHTFTFGLVSP